MLFTSYEFLLFIFISFILYYLMPKKWQWIFLLIVSYIFYFSAGAVYPLFLLATSLITYSAAIWIEKARQKEAAYLIYHKEEFASREEKKRFKEKGSKKRRHIMLLGLLTMLTMLGIFKYADFAIENINTLFHLFGSNKELDYVDLLLPMGISFYTFQSLGYLLDVYWERIETQKNFFKYMLFISFFPQLVQGPISRYSNLSKSLYEEHRFDKREVCFGLQRILWGYFKKLVIADTILTATMMVVGDEYYSGAWVLVGIIFYGIQLYADFTGGIDITIGIAQVFGIKLEENFIRPYFSKNITEFWRRWHISMGTWFRDYIFYPMSISKTLNNVTKRCKKHFGKGVAKRVSVYTATMVTWFATGIWHGASWNFIVWGLMNGIIILISGELKPLYQWFHRQFPSLSGKKGFQIFQIVRTFLLMGSLRLFDCYGDVPLSFSMFFSMFTQFDIKALSIQEFLDLGLNSYQYLIVFLGSILMFAVSYVGRNGSVREKLNNKPFVIRYVAVVSLLFLVILFGSYGIGYDAAQFIYNQF